MITPNIHQTYEHNKGLLKKLLKENGVMYQDISDMLSVLYIDMAEALPSYDQDKVTNFNKSLIDNQSYVNKRFFNYYYNYLILRIKFLIQQTLGTVMLSRYALYDTPTKLDVVPIPDYHENNTPEELEIILKLSYTMEPDTQIDINEAIDSLKLKPKKKEMLMMYYGIGCAQHTLEEVATHFNRSKQVVSLHIIDINNKLKRKLAK